jgi:hypothetical protein
LEFEEKLLQLFGHAKWTDRTRILRKAMDFKFKGIKHMGWPQNKVVHVGTGRYQEDRNTKRENCGKKEETGGSSFIGPYRTGMLLGEDPLT